MPLQMSRHIARICVSFPSSGTTRGCEISNRDVSLSNPVISYFKLFNVFSYYINMTIIRQRRKRKMIPAMN